MADRWGEGLPGPIDQRLIRRWTDPAGEGIAPAERDRARALRDALDAALRLSDARAAEARAPDGLSPYTDWAWRPDLWRRAASPAAFAAGSPETALSPEVRLFHDCPLGEVSAAQVRGTERAPFAVALDVYRFRGSYLSLAIDLPEAAARGLRLRHVLRLDMRVQSERPTAIYGRLNLLAGPRTVQIVRELPPGETSPSVEFDLAATRADLAQVGRMWLDLIVESPDMNAIRLAEVHLSRKPRAEV